MNRETGIQTAIMNYLALVEQRGLGWFMRTNSFGGHVQRRDGSLGYIKNNRAGCPDILGHYRGQFYGLEVKTETGRLSPAQKITQDQISASGGRYVIVRGIDDVQKLFPLTALAQSQSPH